MYNTDCSLFPNLEKKYKKHVGTNMEYAEVFPNMTREQFVERALNLATIKADGKNIFRGTRARDGAIITYNKGTNEIVFEKNGVIDTFFRPDNGMEKHIMTLSSSKGGRNAYLLSLWI
ncbi:hypothetical protein J2T15_004073 [Paenibacillus harenae]|uniref:Uncharacterized protein n=1 Tax=Paenibacillus harenae TaxID=306543 RepID=A0ABT9U4Q2_PAEHA|nr:hypothetical protein [Paenibacillus harenae]